jgi:hypothetical protein
MSGFTSPPGIQTPIEQDLEFASTATFGVHSIRPQIPLNPGDDGTTLVFYGADAAAADPTHPGGNGGGSSQQGGFGGDASAAQPAGNGGPIQNYGGFGGNGTATQPAGDGGNCDNFAGDAGNNAGGGGGDGGAYTIDAGLGSGAGANGQVSIGLVNANQVNMGRSGKFVRSFADGLILPLRTSDVATNPPAGTVTAYFALILGVYSLRIRDSSGTIRSVVLT